MTIQQTLRQAPGEIAANFGPKHLGQTLSYGAVVGVMNIISAVSLMALVFRGDLAYALPVGVGIGLFCSFIAGIVTALASSFEGMVGGVQDSTTAVTGIAAAALALEVTGPDQLSSVIALLVTVSGVTGLVVLLAGHLRLGTFVRFVPHPVIGGFQVASGVLILTGGASIAFPSERSQAFTFDAAVLWVPALVFGVALYLVANRPRTQSWIPLAVVGAIAAAQGLRIAAGVDVDEARDRGWLYQINVDSDGWNLDLILGLTDADWAAVARQTPTIATVAVLTLLAIMIKSQALETATESEVDIDQELQTSGWSMLLSLPAAGPPSYMFFGHSLLIRRLSGVGRGTALLSIIITGAALLAGATLLTIVPTFMISALLIYQGLDFMMVWVWDSRKSLDRLEYLLVVGSGIAVIVLGFLWAIALGTVAAIALFVYRYSRVSAIRHSFTLRDFRSGTDRSPFETKVLEDRGRSALVFELDGYLFFGTAYSVFLDPRILNATEPPSHVIFDLTRVTGVDSSASVALAKLERVSADDGLLMILAGPEHIADRLLAELGSGSDRILRFDTLDAAVARCEADFLADVRSEPEVGEQALLRLFVAMVGPERADQILQTLRRREYPAGSTVVEMGQSAPGLLFLEQGTLAAQLPSASGPPIPLRTMLPATVLGEISLYAGGRATAEVIAAEDSAVRQISADELEALERSDPELAAAIHRVTAETLAGRVIHAERALRTLRS